MRGRVEDRDHSTPQVGDLAVRDPFEGLGLSPGDPESAQLACGESLEDLTDPNQVELPVVESTQGNTDEERPDRQGSGPAPRFDRAVRPASLQRILEVRWEAGTIDEEGRLLAGGSGYSHDTSQ